MPATVSKIAPCLWFDGRAEDAARFYVSLFRDSAIDAVSYYSEEGVAVHGRTPGSVMTVAFHLAGQPFTALNGGPEFPFTEAVSLQVFCDSQDEVDYFWSRLSEGGQEGVCGWLKDQFGLSWQVVPAALPTMMCDPDAKKSRRATRALLEMKKLDIAALQRAFDGA